MPTKKNKKQRQTTANKKPVSTARAVATKPKPITRDLPPAWRIAGNCLRLLRDNWKPFSILTLIYALLTLVFVREFSGGIDVRVLQNEFSAVFGGRSSLKTGAATFFTLLTDNPSSSNGAGGVYQLFVVVLCSLAAIWALRASKAGELWRVRDAFYKGMYPLVPFLLVMVVIALQLLPSLVGASILGVVSGSIAITILEKLPWILLFIGLSILSAYFLSSSLIALYTVTLPDMTPLRALRSAKQLVAGRRLPVVRKLLFLPAALLVFYLLIVLPAILLVPVIASWLFFALSMVMLVVVHAYMYELYRELLIETDV